MSASKGGKGHEVDADAAVNQVLAAEQEALAEIRAAEVAAAERIARARAMARRIVDRAGERVSRLESLCQAAIAGRVAELRRQEESLRDDPAPVDAHDERMDAAIQRLVDAQVGDSP